MLLMTFREASAISVAAGTTEKEHIEMCRLTRDDKKGGDKSTPCAFPFKYDGVTYDGICTNKSDPNGDYWCSTKTDKRGRHKPGGGHWGYCNEGCGTKPTIQRTVLEARAYCNETLSEGGSKPNTPCVWPFRFNKKLYDGVCSNVGDPDGRYWCSTKTIQGGKRKGQHLKGGNWGYCQPGCDIEPATKI